MLNEKIDYRKVSPDEVYAAKKIVIRLWKSEKPTAEIVTATGMSINSVRETIRKYKESGMTGLKPKKRGRSHGEKRSLTADQEKWLRSVITDKTPDQLKFKCCLWNRNTVKELIDQQYGVNMPIRTVGLYLQRWGFSVQKPAKLAKNQKPEQIQAWLVEEYPAIRKQAKSENAEIYWADETAVQNESNYIRGYAPKGRTPVIKVQTVKMHVSMISAINNEGKIRFMIYKDAMNADTMIEFAGRLIKDAARKVYLILDNLRAHHGNRLRDWASEHAGQIALFFLPPYAPEYNPDEYLNHDLKQNIGSQAQADSVSEIEANTTAFLSKLETEPDHVKSYFQHPKVKEYDT